MANQLSGQTGPSPKSNRNHSRHSVYARETNHSDQFPAFLARIATKLTSTSAVIFAKVKKYGAAQVNAATNISQLP